MLQFLSVRVWPNGTEFLNNYFYRYIVRLKTDILYCNYWIMTEKLVFVQGDKLPTCYKATIAIYSVATQP